MIKVPYFSNLGSGVPKIIKYVFRKETLAPWGECIWRWKTWRQENKRQLHSYWDEEGLNLGLFKVELQLLYKSNTVNIFGLNGLIIVSKTLATENFVAHLNTPCVTVTMAYDSTNRCRQTQLCACALRHRWLCDPMDCRPPGSSVHGIFQARNTGVRCHVLL